MSYRLLKSELKVQLFKQHNDRYKFAKVLSNAYVKFVMRHFDTLTGGGKPAGITAKGTVLKRQIQTILDKNFKSERKINFFNDLEPFIKTFWTGVTITGPTGIVIINNPGIFKGPPVIENNNIDIWLGILNGVIGIHMLSMTGIYTNAYTGITVPWTSALLKTTP